MPVSLKSSAGSKPIESDDPIQSWEQDALGRAALVDALSVKLMVGKAPVIALSGRFGSGKTSTLNLLRQHLEGKAITVFFSSWLPGSQETLTSYLLADIANECGKLYIIPGLRQSARRLAKALGQKVPIVSDYLNLLPSATQRDDIRNLQSALSRLPKRVIVLLDEIDRMDKEELITLLKVVRGISTLPNVSFVCAGDRETIVETVKGQSNEKNNAYFEKFFPVLVEISDPAPVALREAGTQRLVAAFDRRDWFQKEADRDSFKHAIEELWDDRIAPFCRNLRAIGLLANDVSVAAAPLRREVDPADLTLIEVLHRFHPAVYRLVATSGSALTGGESVERGGRPQLEEDRKKNLAKFLVAVGAEVPDEPQLQQVEGILFELFPNLPLADAKLARLLPRKRKDQTQHDEKRISDPGIFPAYFRFELPDEIFSSVEMDVLIRRLEGAPEGSARDTVFTDALNSMEKGSLKRDDFLRKLAEAARKIPLPIAKSVCEAAVKASRQYAYDTLPAFAEAGHVLRMVLVVAQRLPNTQQTRFLEECILSASDDTMAFRILTTLTQQQGEEKVAVSLSDLYSSFIERMRSRYGRDVDAATIDLSISDAWAFDYWGRKQTADGTTSDPQDRDIQRDFWLRYIGNSRRRLAEAFRAFFLPVGVYKQNPEPIVENKIPLADLRRLYRDLPEDRELTSRDQKSLEALGRLLGGEFKTGIDPFSTAW